MSTINNAIIGIIIAGVIFIKYDETSMPSRIV